MSSRPLAIPLEVLEEILALSFIPSSKYELADPNPPPFNLLLLSKAIRQICLPLFWKAITIAKRQDWFSLFDPKEGLVVVGEEGRRRWEMVEEIRIAIDTKIPYPRTSFDRPELRELAIPSYRRIPTIVLQHSTHLPTPGHGIPPYWDMEQTPVELILRLLQPDSERYYVESDPQEDEFSKYLAGELSHEELMADPNDAPTLDDQLSDSEEPLDQIAPFTSFLPGPGHLITPIEFWADWALGNQASRKNGWTVELTRRGSSDDYLRKLPYDDRVFDNNVDVRLVGFPPDGMKDLEVHMKSEEGKNQAFGRTWHSTWSWEREDGSTFFIEFRSPLYD